MKLFEMIRMYPDYINCTKMEIWFSLFKLKIKDKYTFVSKIPRLRKRSMSAKFKSSVFNQKSTIFWTGLNDDNFISQIQETAFL